MSIRGTEQQQQAQQQIQMQQMQQQQMGAQNQGYSDEHKNNLNNISQQHALLLADICLRFEDMSVRKSNVQVLPSAMCSHMTAAAQVNNNSLRLSHYPIPYSLLVSYNATTSSNIHIITHFASISLSLPNTHTHTHTLSLSLTPTHIHPPALTVLIPYLPSPPPPSLSPSHTHPLILSLTHTLRL